MKKVKLKLKFKEAWLIIASLILVSTFFIYHGDDSDTTLKICMSISSISMLFSLATYEYKVHISLFLLMISTVAGYIPSGFKLGQIEIGVSILATITTLLITIRSIPKQELSIKNIITANKSPNNINNTIRLMVIILIITVIFQVPNSYKSYTGDTVTWLASAYTVLPILAILLSINPIYDVVMLRIIHNLIWIYIIQMASTVKMASQINMIEPVVYIATIIIFNKAVNKMLLKHKERKHGK